MKWWIVATNEIKTTFSRKWFIIFTFGVPIAFMLVFIGIRLVQGDGSERSPAPETEMLPKIGSEGYVDPAGLISQLPADLPPGVLQAFPSETQAAQAMRQGQISAYYVIPDNYLATGELTYIRREYNPLGGGGQQHIIRWVLLYNLVGRDLQLASQVLNPANLQETNLALLAASGAGLSQECLTPGYACEDSAFLRFLPLIFLLIFFMAVLTASSQLLHQLAIEKENRVLEVLTLSASARELMGGKIVGLGVVGLIQVLVWLTTTYVLTIAGASTFNLPEGFSIPTWYIGWGIAYFLFGYTLYGSLMAGAGALTPDTKSYSGTAMMVSSPMYVAYILTFILGEDPHGTLATFLSLFPLTSPVTMMWRLVQTGVPPWQLYLSAGLLVVTSLLVMRSVARIFRAQELLSGQPFKLGKYVRVLVRG